MGIDIERLKVDREYWDSVAPEGATHYIGDPSYQDGSDWEKRTYEDRKVWVYPDGKWRNMPWKPKLELQRIYKYFIPRPEPRKVEWDGEGLPPVGCECGLTLGFTDYQHVRITYVGDGVFCYLNMRTNMEYTGSTGDAQFRPIRTKEQREADEALKAIGNGGMCDDIPVIHVKKVINAIIAAGWTKDQ